MKSKIILQLFLTFLKIGSFTFGGGYAMIPLITTEAVHRHKWIQEKDILDIVAVAESTPGPIAVNSATFVGYRIAGFWGAVFSTIGVVLPSFVIIFLLSRVLEQFGHLKPVRYAFTGIRAGVLALIFKALLSMYKACPKSVFAYILMAASFILVAIIKADILIVIAGCGIAGIIQAFIIRRVVSSK